jgi:Protein of unknown function (DUF4254)
MEAALPSAGQTLPPLDLLERLAAAGAKVDLLPRLAEVHDRLWTVEDMARSRRADDSAVVAAKREIDRLNGERHRLIDRIDADVSRGDERPGAIAYPETLGELCDRILILRLKARHSDAHADDPELPAAVRGECEAQAARFRAWLAHLERAAEELLRDLEHGRAALPPRAELKMYDDEVLNPVTRAELG